MDYADIVRDVGRTTAGEDASKVVSIIDFCESKVFGLGVDLFPVQRIILKAHYGIPLEESDPSIDLDDLLQKDDETLYKLACKVRPNLPEDSYDAEELAHIIQGTPIPLRNWRGEHLAWMSEGDYVRWLHEEGRCNIDHVEPGEERRELILAVGRRSGKTMLASCIVAYETYKLIKKENPHRFYGLVESNPLQLVSVATDKDQAGLLYAEVATHFGNCEFFTPYQANSTESYAKFQTPVDQEKFGLYKENKHARRSIKVTFRPCVAKGLRGAGNLVVILDEVAHFMDNSNQQSADAIYTAVQPSLAAFSPKDKKNKRKPIGPSEGRMIMISSPLGKEGLFYELFDKAMKGGVASDGVFAMQAPTWEVNPTIEASFFRKSYAKDARKFYQEFGAVFTDKSKGWIEDEQDLLDCVDDELRPRLQGIPRVPYFMGIDIGVKKDATAIAIGHIDQIEQRIILDLIVKMQAGKDDFEINEEGEKVIRLDFGEILDTIVDLSRKFHISEGIFDQEQGVALEHLLKRKGLKQIRMERMTDTLNSDIYTAFKSLMYDRRVKLYNHPVPHGERNCEYIQQLLDLQAEYKSKYKVKVYAPKREGAHDDLADALVRMVWLASQRFAKGNEITTVRRGQIALAGGASHRLGTNSKHRFRDYARMGGTHPTRMIPGRGRGRGGGGGGRRY